MLTDLLAQIGGGAILADGIFDQINKLSSQAESSAKTITGLMIILGTLFILFKMHFTVKGIVMGLGIGALLFWIVPLGGFETIGHWIDGTVS